MISIYLFIIIILSAFTPNTFKHVFLCIKTMVSSEEE